MKMLFGDPVPGGQVEDLIKSTSRHHRTVVWRMLDPKTPNEVLKYYICCAREAMESDIRIKMQNLNGCRDVDSSINLAILAKLYDDRSRYGSALRSPTGNKQEAVKLQRLGEHFSLIEKLIQLSESDHSDPNDLQLLRVLFFYILSSSRTMGSIVCRTVHKKRLPDDLPLLPEETLMFFDGLNQLTDNHYATEIDGPTYLSELESLYNTGMSLGQKKNLPPFDRS